MEALDAGQVAMKHQSILLFHSFLHSFIYSFIHSFIHSFISIFVSRPARTNNLQ